MSNFWKWFVYYGNMLCRFMPMILMISFVTKISKLGCIAITELGCIAITDKVYIMLGCIAVITYWTMNFIGGENE